MAIYAVRKKGESVDRLINRFKRQVQHSRVLLKVRNGRFHKKPKTKIQIREGAVKREFYRAKRRKNMFYM